MPTELEELVDFLHHGNTQIRQIATENLLPYSKTQPIIFKTGQFTPIKDLKLLVKDYPAIARNALTILINISTDPEILKSLAEDDAFLETILSRITNPKEPTANLFSMLLANLTKSDSLSRLLTLTRSAIPSLPPSTKALDQLLTLFNAGVHGKYNPNATFEYLPYVFADLAKFTPIAFHLTSSSPSSPPLITTLTPHLSPPTKPLPLRLGTTTTLRNTLLALPSPTTSIPPLIPYILPALLLPLIGPDPPFTEAETELLPPECQYLGPEQVREGNTNVLHGVVEVIFLLAVRGGREVVEGMKGRGVYPVLREAHLGVEDEGVREVVERCVQALMGEEGDEGKGRQEGGRVEEVGEKDGKGHGGKREKSGDSDEEKIVEVF